MSNDLLILLGILVLVGLLFLWMWLQMQSFSRRLKNHAKSIDKLMQANYELNKQNMQMRNAINSYISSSRGASFELEQITKRIDARVNEAIASRILPMIDSLKRLEDSVDDFASEHEGRMLDLEERTKSISKITPPSFEKEEDRIVELYNQGHSIQGIARDLHTTVGRVDMVLRIKKMI